MTVIKTKDDGVRSLAPLGFSNYWITDDGQIFSLYFNRLKRMGLRFNNEGYVLVTLVEDGTNKQRTMTLHRLVAKSFIPNPYLKPCVNHIDSDKTNNCASNLEWNTYSENTKHAISAKKSGKTNPTYRKTRENRKVSGRRRRYFNRVHKTMFKKVIDLS